MSRLRSLLRSARDGTEPRLVWMLGSPRTGSTWLLNLLTVSDRVVSSDEPGIGYHLGLFAADVMGPHPVGFDAAGLLFPEARSADPQYFFADRYEPVWREPLRRLVLERFRAQLADSAAADPVLVIKEPAGSQAAPFLFRLFPSSRLLFLMRDGRDVLDSELDGVSRGGWLAALFTASDDLSAGERLGFLEAQAHRWVSRTRAVQAAYDGLPPAQRLLVRYEDLRADTVAEVSRILGWLGLSVADHRVRDAVQAMAFESLKPEETGKGKFARAAQTGLWRESFNQAELEVVHRVMGATLTSFGYDVSDGA